MLIAFKILTNEFLGCSRPELKPVEKEVEVILRFPEVEPIAPPAIQLDEMSFGYTILFLFLLVFNSFYSLVRISHYVLKK